MNLAAGPRRGDLALKLRVGPLVWATKELLDQLLVTNVDQHTISTKDLVHKIHGAVIMSPNEIEGVDVERV